MLEIGLSLVALCVSPWEHYRIPGVTSVALLYMAMPYIIESMGGDMALLGSVVKKKLQFITDNNK